MGNDKTNTPDEARIEHTPHGMMEQKEQAEGKNKEGKPTADDPEMEQQTRARAEIKTVMENAANKFKEMLHKHKEMPKAILRLDWATREGSEEDINTAINAIELIEEEIKEKEIEETLKNKISPSFEETPHWAKKSM